jgi:hypothetical protein
MQNGGKKFFKPEKTKYRKTTDEDFNRSQKQKKHDKVAYRLMKQDKEDYAV